MLNIYLILEGKEMHLMWLQIIHWLCQNLIGNQKEIWMICVEMHGDGKLIVKTMRAIKPNTY